MFLMYAFMPIVLLFALFLLFTIVNSRIILSNKTQEAGKIISQRISDIYNNYYDEVNRIASLPIVIDFASTRLGSEKVYEELYDFNAKQAVKSMFHVVDTNGVYLAFSGLPDTSDNEAVLQSILPRIAKAGDGTLMETNQVRYSHERNTVFTVGKAIRNQDEIVGYLIFQLYEEDVQKLIFVSNNEMSVLTDEFHTIIATTNNITRGLMNKFTPSVDAKGNVRFNDIKYHMGETDAWSGHLKVYTMNSTGVPKYTYYSLIVFIVVTSVMLLFLLRFLAHKMSSRNTQSFDKLLYAVSQLQQGNMVSYVEIQTGDEFETLAKQYNIMLNRLNELMSKNEKLSNIRRIIEVKQLQSQFHPHFLFNVLETLRYAIVVDSSRAQEIVMKLSKLLRYSINNDAQTVLLHDDLNYTVDYLHLQQLRFNDRLSYSVQVSKEARQALVPKLLLQAIIENAIKYGYQQQDKLLISIRGFLSGSDLILEVEDDGCGISEARLHQIRTVFLSPDNPSKHIGLNNVHRRLVLLYGEQYGVDIQSVQGSGTHVRIVIPYQRGDQDV